MKVLKERFEFIDLFNKLLTKFQDKHILKFLIKNKNRS